MYLSGNSFSFLIFISASFAFNCRWFYAALGNLIPPFLFLGVQNILGHPPSLHVTNLVHVPFYPHLKNGYHFLSCISDSTGLSEDLYFNFFGRGVAGIGNLSLFVCSYWLCFWIGLNSLVLFFHASCIISWKPKLIKIHTSPTGITWLRMTVFLVNDLFLIL